MLSNPSNWLTEKSTGRVTLAALVVFILFTAIVLPDQAVKARESSGSAESPDTSFFYTAKDLYRMAEEYGPGGRAAYIRARFTFDVIWPVVYTVFLLTATSWLGGRLFSGSRWRLLNLVPLAGTLLDFMENSGASLVFARYPAATPVVDVLTPVSTLLKWVFITVSFVILVVMAAAALWKVIKKNLG
jgi:hypothetical protein